MPFPDDASQSTSVLSPASDPPSAHVPPPGEFPHSTVLKAPPDPPPPFTGVVTPSSQPSGTAGMVPPPIYPLRTTVELAAPGQPLTAPTYVLPNEPPPAPLRRRRRLGWLIAAVLCAVMLATLAALPSLLSPGASKSAHSGTSSLTSSLLSPTSKSASPFTPISNPSATPAPSPTAGPSRPPSVNPSTLNFNLTPLSGSSTQPLRLSSGSQPESWSAQTGGFQRVNLNVISGKINPGQTQFVTETVKPTKLVPGIFTD